MGSTFHGLETAVKSLYTQQTAINTAGHNISNANTKGYSRQIVSLEADRPLYVPAINTENSTGQLGTGVSVSEITRIRETYLDDQYRDMNSEYGEWQIKENSLGKIESITNEPSDQSISSVLNDFWNSWSDLATQPDSLTARTVVVETAVTLVESINDVANNLSDLEDDLVSGLDIVVGDSNTLISQIAELNREIARIETLGDNANDLRDERDLYTDKLSKYLNINVKETSSGYTITSGENTLVEGFIASPLDANSLPGDISSGQIKGYQESISEVNIYQNQLDELVRGIVEGEFQLTIPAGTIIPEGQTLTFVDDTEVTFSGDRASRRLISDVTIKIDGVNGLHQLGYTLGDPLTSGEAFFTTNDGSSDFNATNVEVNSNIANDASKIACSTNTYIESDGSEQVVRGNNDIANWLGELRNLDISFDSSLTDSPIEGHGTIGEYYNAMIGQLGVKEQEAMRQISNKESLVNQIENSRQSVSGVSLDEEMANLIKFQSAYNSAARMITTLDELYDKLINSTGVVGR